VLSYFRDAGLKVRELFYGWWFDPSLAHRGSYQDMILAEKTVAA
jgi:hypothetical protein